MQYLLTLKYGQICLQILKKKSISINVINARITKKSFKKWKILSSLQKIISKFDICYPSSMSQKNILRYLGAKKIKYIGNLKFSEAKQLQKN